MYPDGKLKTSRLYGIVVLSVNRTLIMQEKSIFMSFLEDLILQRRLMIGLRNIPILKLKKELSPIVKPARGKRGYKINVDEEELARRLDGRSLFFSTDITMPGKELIRTYFQKDHIEKQ